MIFGAGINQLELIREARKMEVTTIVIDPSENPPGKKEADLYYQVPGNDYETTREIALKHNIDGIVTGQMEKPLRLMAKLAAELGLSFHSEAVIEKSLNKWLMKQAFLKDGIPCARGVILKKDQELTKDVLHELDFPVIIKPVDAFSSRGVYKAESFEELKAYRNDTINYASDGNIIIEEFLAGKEFSIESITFEGKTEIIQFTEKFITPYPNTVEMGHLQPADLTDKECDQISMLVKKAIIALEIDHSASHAEVILTNDGPKMVEIGARLGGDFIASYLTKASTGISMDKAAVQIALGIKPDLAKAENAFSYIKYFHLPEGAKIKTATIPDELKTMEGMVFSAIFGQPGDIIPKLNHSAQRTGCILVKAESREWVIQLAEKYEDILTRNIQFIM